MFAQSFVERNNFLTKQPTAHDALLALESEKVSIVNSSAFYKYRYSRRDFRCVVEIGNERIGIVYAQALRANGKPLNEILEITFETEYGRKQGFLHVEFVNGQIRRIRKQNRWVTEFDESLSVPIIKILAATRKTVRLWGCVGAPAFFRRGFCTS